ncbi:hypothetical protein BGZ59_008831 [Podila verticillata]|nr:hypothetical protein BGZ59_008831 [Podila verticillata]KFH71132.1 hypothetical protein MVEG_03978 [Podila verticillata NRRL 6337]
MYIPGYTSSPSTDGGVLSGIILGRKTHPDTSSSSDPTSPTRHTETITYLLPLVITGIFLLITVSTLVLARCLYRRFKATNISPSPSNPWKLFYSSRGQDPSGSYASFPQYDQQYLDSLDDEARGEYERLLARRRSTSYYDANRSRAPVPVVIRYDTKGRPISTWSTASSVAAARGEELSQWSRRRDDLIRIYGNSSQRNSSLTGMGVFEDGLEEEPEETEETEEQQDQEVSEDHPSTSSGHYAGEGQEEYPGGSNKKDGHLAPPR